MIVKLGVNSSTHTKIDKTVNYPAAGNKTGTLKDMTDVVNPTIIVDGTSDIFSGYNYMEIPAFGRFYFITDIKSVRQGLVEITGHCDVLSTAGSQIKTHNCIVATAQTGFNKRINDGSFKVYQNRYVINDFIFPSTFEAPGDYVLALAGS